MQMKSEIPKYKLQIYILISNLSDAGSDFRVAITMKERVHY